jgi:hypothetical protein
MGLDGSLPCSQETVTGYSPVHILTSYFSKVHFNIILSSKPRFLNDLFTSGLSADNLYFHFPVRKSRDSSVGIALRYGLDDRGCRVRFLTGAGDFSLHHRVQNGFGAHPASYPMGIRGSFPGGKVAGA